MKYLDKYNDIMAKYKRGEYGTENLSLYDILDRADSVDIFDRMDISEIQELLDSTSGIAKMMFSMLKKKKESKVDIWNK